MKTKGNIVGKTESLSEDFSKYIGKKVILENKYKSFPFFPEKYLDDLLWSEREFIEKYDY